MRYAIYVFGEKVDASNDRDRIIATFAEHTGLDRDHISIQFVDNDGDCGPWQLVDREREKTDE